MAYKITSAPASEPVSLSDMKEHLRVVHTDDDDYITSLIVAARVWIERQYDIAIITQTVTEYFDEFADWTLSVGPTASITSVKYYDEDNAQQTLATSAYDTDTVSFKARIHPNSTANVTVDDRINAIEIVYVAGEATAAPSIAHAIKLIVGDWYKDRERMPGNVKTRLLDTVEKLLYPYAIHAQGSI